MTFPEFGVKRPVTNLMIFTAAIVLGLFSLHFLPIDLMPKIDPPAITVTTIYPGASAEDVETKITQPIENDLSIVSNLDELVSFSQEGISTVTCKFNWGENLDEAANNIRDRLDFTKRKLPTDAQQPMIIKFDTSMIPILGMGVTAKESWEKLYDIVDVQLSEALKRVPGVGAIQIIGGMEREIHVELNQNKMDAYGLSVREIESAIKNSNITIPAGSLKVGKNEYMLRMPGEFQKVGEIGRTIVKESKGKLVHLSDIAFVKDSFKEMKMNVLVDGDKGMMMMVQKQSGSNSVEVAHAVRDKLDEIRKTLPADVKINEMFNTAQFIEQTIDNLSTTIMWGGILVILVMLFFLRDLRGSLIIALTIPFSLIITLIFVYAFGMTINMMSLASLSIAVGMVVDNAVVVLENIAYHRSIGKPLKEAAIFGSSEVGLAISASTLTTIVVFVPLIFMTGISGIMFKELGIAIIVTLLASLFTALTMTPMLASQLLKTVEEEKEGWYKVFYKWSENIFNKIEATYANMLGWALHNRALVIAGSFIIFVLSVLLVPFIGSEFIPAEDTGDLWITVELPVGKRVEETVKFGETLRKIFEAEAGKYIKHLFVRSGKSDFGSMSGQKEGPNVVMVGAKLVALSERDIGIEEIGNRIREKYKLLPGVVKITVDSGNPLNRMLIGGAKPMSVDIIGEDMDKTNQFAAAVRDVMLKTPGTSDVSISRDVAKPELSININEDKAGLVGLNKATIGQTLRTYFYGNDTLKYRTGRKEYNILINLRPEDRQYVENVRDISIPSPGGERVPLSSIAAITEKTGSIEIERENQERIVRVSSNVYGRSLGEVAADVEEGISHIPRPPDIKVNIGGLVKEQRKSFADMQLLLLLSIMLVYMVMAAQFESLLHPFIIMFSVPFAFSGVLFALWIAGYALSLVTILGAVLLVGIAVNNAIVLIDYINILRSRGVVLAEAVLQAGRRRLRPILMTSLTTIFGLIPMAFAGGEGSESFRPIGMTILSGLTVSMFISLILVPVIYSLVNMDKKVIAKSTTPANAHDPSQDMPEGG
ncbi:MAG: efflux RND transporter permease subunit [Planctomycetes bacterium]|nr:efflux RND transporter permease subunit [Planctomycetota bacterium]